MRDATIYKWLEEYLPGTNSGSELVMLNLREKLKQFYQPPFRYEHGYVFDSTHKMIADVATDDAPLMAAKLRSWSQLIRKHGVDDGAVLRDKLGLVIAEALNEYWDRIEA